LDCGGGDDDVGLFVVYIYHEWFEAGDELVVVVMQRRIRNQTESCQLYVLLSSQSTLGSNLCRPRYQVNVKIGVK
jgi:hypothetical protein